MLTKFLFKSVEYEIDLPYLVKPLVLLPGDTHLLHPIDCLRLGVHNGGYFNSRQSNRVHDGKSVLRRYVQGADVVFLPNCYREPITDLGKPEWNHFSVSASSSYDEWLANGWIQPSAPEGWFECYTQAVTQNDYEWPVGYMGLTDWAVEQKRMLSFVARHAGQIRANCPVDLSKRKRQRQALLNWASPFAFL